MVNKISLISSLVLMVLGLLGIGVFVALFLFGEGAGAYASALVISLILVITSVLDLTVLRPVLNEKYAKNEEKEEEK